MGFFGGQMWGHVRRGRWDRLKPRRGKNGGEGISGMMRSFKALYASYDKGIVGGGREVRLARERCCVTVNQG